MRISRLSRHVGLPIPTIKFYLREGLMPRGRPTSRNQAEYGDEHLRRLRLIRVLTTIGQLTLSSVRNLVAAIESDKASMADMIRTLGEAALPAQHDVRDVNSRPGAAAKVEKIITTLDWTVARDGPGYSLLTLTLDALDEIDCEAEFDFLHSYAQCAGRLAAAELQAMPDSKALENCEATFVARTLLLDTAMVALRRLAQEHQAARS